MRNIVSIIFIIGLIGSSIQQETQKNDVEKQQLIDLIFEKIGSQKNDNEQSKLEQVISFLESQQQDDSQKLEEVPEQLELSEEEQIISPIEMTEQIVDQKIDESMQDTTELDEISEQNEEQLQEAPKEVEKSEEEQIFDPIEMTKQIDDVKIDESNQDTTDLEMVSVQKEEKLQEAPKEVEKQEEEQILAPIEKAQDDVSTDEVSLNEITQQNEVQQLSQDNIQDDLSIEDEQNEILEQKEKEKSDPLDKIQIIPLNLTEVFVKQLIKQDGQQQEMISKNVMDQNLEQKQEKLDNQDEKTSRIIPFLAYLNNRYISYSKDNQITFREISRVRLNQVWFLKELQDDRFRLLTRRGKLLTINDDGSVQLSDKENQGNLFRIIHNIDGTFSVLSDLGKYISFKDDSQDLGSSIMQSANTNFNYSIDFIKHQLNKKRIKQIRQKISELQLK